MLIRPCDVECYRNYFLVKFYDLLTGTFQDFEMYPGKPLDIAGLRMAMSLGTIVTFNGLHYDMPIIAAALNGADNATLKAYTDQIIVGRVKYWEFYRLNNIPELDWVDHIDLREVAPGVGIGLKMYGGRMHSHTLEDLPYDPSIDLTWEQMQHTNKYCGNDLLITADLYRECKERIELREAIGARHGIDVRSKSDAQISEAVIKAQLPFSPQKQVLPHGYQFFYKAPEFITFTTPQLQNVLYLVQTTAFVVNDPDQIRLGPGDEIYDQDGKKVTTGVKIPKEIKGLDIRIGDSVYRMGIGGLHSQESSVWHMTTADYVLSDHDVGSYYPSLILLMDMYPAAIGHEFNPIYRAIYNERMAAKVQKQKTIANGLKITLNGAFGKLGSKYSILFAPELLIRTTITGQLSLLMLIEALEAVGISVVSANTDGIVLKTPVHLCQLRDDILKWWEQRTGLETEATFYKAIFSRDVNNYVAFKMDGEHKGKGIFTDSGVLNNKHPDREICKDAAIAYLAHGTPLAQTIRSCQDIRKFLRVRNVKGGGYWTTTGEYLGKSVRWYYGVNTSACIRYTSTNNKVADSEGAVPMMTLATSLPGDIDYGYYERAAAEMIRTLGVYAA